MKIGQEQVLEALPCCSWDVMMGLIWGTDRDAEMEKRETGGSLPLQLQETTLVL